MNGIDLPEKFTFPFYYEPHPLTTRASEILFSYLENQNDFKHNFGLIPNREGIELGKMFGVLVVKTPSNELAFLAAYSGKLMDNSRPEIFVPPVFDVHDKDSFYKRAEEKLNKLNAEIDKAEIDPNYLKLKSELAEFRDQMESRLKKERTLLKQGKKERQSIREYNQSRMEASEFNKLKEKLAQESIGLQLEYKRLSIQLKSKLEQLEKKLLVYDEKINSLKRERKEKSSNIQKRIFESYNFLNAEGNTQSIADIFPDFQTQAPPAGTGDCAAPKLLQYAYQNNLKPVCMGEFWWGISPKTEIRKHKYFYPSCNSRCKPILGHMLKGLDLMDNPFINHTDEHLHIEYLYEDEELLVINKPAEMLSVPGKEVTSSVYSRIKEKHPEFSGPIIVHRLDMSTSGLMVLAKNKEAHKVLQEQFINRTVKKRYVALIDGVIEDDKGEIELPLRVDLEDRPRQMVCYQYGKHAKTLWKRLKQEGQLTRVHLFPITGRTHQLRVHMAHPLGLNMAIIGDDLYGRKADRLHLHAEYLSFLHPTTKKKLHFLKAPEF